jgi:hypothetical protein
LAEPSIPQVTERSVPWLRSLTAGAGGDWPVINERVSADVVRQMQDLSCVSAAGEMLSEGTVSQQALIEKLGAPADVLQLPEELGSGWEARRVSPESLKALVGRGSFGAELFETPPSIRYQRLPPTHTVVVDGLDEAGNVMIRDSKHGTRYEMIRSDFMKVWTGGAVWRR